MVGWLVFTEQHTVYKYRWYTLYHFSSVEIMKNVCIYTAIVSYKVLQNYLALTCCYGNWSNYVHITEVNDDNVEIWG